MKPTLLALVLFCLCFVPALAQFGGGSGAATGPALEIIQVQPGGLDEVVLLRNATGAPVDLEGWKLRVSEWGAGAGLEFSFPARCALPPGGAVSVHAGPATLFRASQPCDQAQFHLVWQFWFALPDQAAQLTLFSPSGKIVYTYLYPQPRLYINEVELNPGGDEQGREWVELYNAGNRTLPLADWTLNVMKGTSVKLSVPLEGILPARGFLRVQVGLEFLNNQEEILELRDLNGKLMNATPPAGLSDELGDERCWARLPDGARGWDFQPCTPEQRNGEP